MDSGENYDDCALRELREEIGLTPSKPLEKLFKIDACAHTGQEFVWIYRCDSEGPFKLHPEEIERGQWFASEFVTDWIKSKPKDFARAFVLIWSQWMDFKS